MFFWTCSNLPASNLDTSSVVDDTDEDHSNSYYPNPDHAEFEDKLQNDIEDLNQLVDSAPLEEITGRLRSIFATYHTIYSRTQIVSRLPPAIQAILTITNGRIKLRQLVDSTARNWDVTSATILQTFQDTESERFFGALRTMSRKYTMAMALPALVNAQERRKAGKAGPRLSRTVEWTPHDIDAAGAALDLAASAGPSSPAPSTAAEPAAPSTIAGPSAPVPSTAAAPATLPAPPVSRTIAGPSTATAPTETPAPASRTVADPATPNVPAMHSRSAPAMANVPSADVAMAKVPVTTASADAPAPATGLVLGIPRPGTPRPDSPAKSVNALTPTTSLGPATASRNRRRTSFWSSSHSIPGALVPASPNQSYDVLEVESGRAYDPPSPDQDRSVSMVITPLSPTLDDILANDTSGPVEDETNEVEAAIPVAESDEEVSKQEGDEAESLAPGARLTGDAVNLCLSLIIGALPSGQFRLLPSGWSVANSMASYVEPTPPAKGYLVPLHLPRSEHWVLLHVGADGANVDVLDSFKNGLPQWRDEVEMLVSRLASTHLAHYMQPEPSTKFIGGPQQQNGTDCGVFVVANALHIVTTGRPAPSTADGTL